jgi:hypothetical protein
MSFPWALCHQEVLLRTHRSSLLRQLIFEAALFAPSRNPLTVNRKAIPVCPSLPKCAPTIAVW